MNKVGHDPLMLNGALRQASDRAKREGQVMLIFHDQHSRWYVRSFSEHYGKEGASIREEGVTLRAVASVYPSHPDSPVYMRDYPEKWQV